MSRYIDLRDAIVDDLHLTESEASGVDAAMSWLHMHPDQVPGRTITEGEAIEALDELATDFDSIDHDNGEQWSKVARINAERLGLTVTDIEPANAEKLQELVNAEWWIDYGSLAEYLDANGVKAGN